MFHNLNWGEEEDEEGAGFGGTGGMSKCVVL